MNSNEALGKRKQPPNSSGYRMDRKRQKLQDARKIAVQASGHAFKNGEIDVDKFVKAREYEIKALEDGMSRSKKALATRAFQDVPRDLRRRTASHNVKRVPKRLRARAAEEMLEDNTPTVQARRRKPTSHKRLRMDTATQLRKLHQNAKTKSSQKEDDVQVSVLKDGQSRAGIQRESQSDNQVQKKHKQKLKKLKSDGLKGPLVPQGKFRKRQKFKSWLPTHMFHTKRAHMTPPKEPLWRFAIPITPTMKCYRPTHRATRNRGAMAWDMSYTSTIGLRGQERCVEGLLKAIGIGSGGDAQGCWLSRGKKWREGLRSWEGWVFEQQGWPTKPIAPITVIWASAENQGGEQADTEIKDAQTGTSSRIRQAFIRVHPSAFLQLWTEVLNLSKVQHPSVAIEDLRFGIGSIEVMGPGSTEALVGVLNPSSTSSNQSTDKTSELWKNLASINNAACLPRNVVLAFNITDPRLRHPPRRLESSVQGVDDLIQMVARWPVDTKMMSPTIFDKKQRAKSERELPSQKSINRRRAQADPGEYPEPLPRDPPIPSVLFTTMMGDGQTKWTLLLPWKCVLPVWYSLMYYPLSTGGNVRFGGLDEQRQVAYESGTPWFPSDFPGTRAGSQWEDTHSVKRHLDWSKRPKGKRVEWQSIDLGNGAKGELGDGWVCDWTYLNRTMNQSPDKNLRLFNLTSRLAIDILKGKAKKPISDDATAIVTVKLTLIGRGVPTTCGRVYRLPSSNEELRKRWVSQQHSKRENKTKSSPCQAEKDEAPHVKRQKLAQRLLNPPSNHPGDSQYPHVPPEEDLIGFVTTGNFNLAEGLATAFGSLLVDKVPAFDGARGSEEYLCIVRDAGQTIGRLARWEVV